jgi:hypothetical protein
VTGATTIYYTPYVSNTSVVWDGTAFKTISVGEVSTTLSGATSGLPYDVFQDSSGGIEVLAWTNTTTRATALVADAIGYTKSGDQTRRYLGTICMSGTGTCEDSKAKRFVWNMYNRVEYKDYRNDSTTSWTDSGNGTWSAIHGGDATWKHEFVRGINEDPVCAEAFLMAGEGYCYAIAMDSTSTLDRAKSTAAGQTPAGQVIGGAAFFRDMPSIGYHYLQALETSYTASAATCYGNLTPGGSTVAAQSGFLTSGRR